MKTVRSQPLLCRAARWQVDVFHGDPARHWHTRRCAHCRAYFEYWEGVQESVHDHPDIVRDLVPPELQALARQIRARRSDPPPRGFLSLGIPSLAAIVATLAVAWPSARAPRERPLLPETPAARTTAVLAARTQAPLAAALLDAPTLDKPTPESALARTTASEVATTLKGNFSAQTPQKGPRS
jgi:anti-sigma factor RsiW